VLNLGKKPGVIIERIGHISINQSFSVGLVAGRKEGP
jgi:hypothetical protein